MGPQDYDGGHQTGVSMKYALLALTLALGACSPSWHTSSVDKIDGVDRAPTNAASITVTESDLTRPYVVLGDLDVTVRKRSLFDADPTRETVNEALREEAAELGADAVILVRYGNVGLSVVSYAALDGRGRAVAYR